MISTDYYEEHLNLLKTQMESQELQKQETSETLAALGDSLNIGLEKIAKAMPKETGPRKHGELMENLRRCAKLSSRGKENDESNWLLKAI